MNLSSSTRFPFVATAVIAAARIAAASDVTVFAPIANSLQSPDYVSTSVVSTVRIDLPISPAFDVPVADWGFSLPPVLPIGYLPRDTIIVNTTAVRGNGNDIISFSDAIDRANASGGATTIMFGGSVNWNTAVIGPNFPSVTGNNVTIIGGFNGGAPRIRIGGASNLDGIVIAGNNCLVEGLYISSFGRGMVVTGSNNVIRSCSFGANNRDGIEINGANNTIGPGIIANSNTRFGIIIAGVGATGNAILNSQAAFNSNPTTACGLGITNGASNNTIGPGALFAANGSEGIVIQGGAHDNTFVQVGVGQNLAPASTPYPNGHNGVGISAFNGPPMRNHFVDCSIGSNGWSGVFVTGVDCNGHTFERCRIGTSPNGLAARANGQHGIVFADGAKDNEVGPQSVISGNAWSGVVFYGNAGSTERNALRESIVGLSADQTLPLPNGHHGVSVFSVASTGNPARLNVIGQSNVIAGNVLDGINMSGEQCTDNTLVVNVIGATRDLSALRPNGRHAIALLDRCRMVMRNPGNFCAASMASPSVATIRVADGASFELTEETPTFLTVGGSGISDEPRTADREIEVMPQDPAMGREGWIELADGTIKAQRIVLRPQLNLGMPSPQTAMLTGFGYLAAAVENAGLMDIAGPYSGCPYPEPWNTPWALDCHSQLWVLGAITQRQEGELRVRITDAIATDNGDQNVPVYTPNDAMLGGRLSLVHDDQSLTLLTPATRFNLLECFRISSRFSQVSRLAVNDDVFLGVLYLEFEEGRHIGELQGLQLDVLKTPYLVLPGGSSMRMTSNLSPVTAALRPRLSLIAHGTLSQADPPTSDFWALATHMRDGLHTPGSWAVATMDWQEDASDQPIDTAEIAMDIGENLARWLDEIGFRYSHIHAMSHSSGSWLADGVIDQWKRVYPGTWCHTTLWDAYNPTTFLSRPGGMPIALGDSADFCDHVVNMGAAIGTNDVLRHAVNIEISPLILGTACDLSPVCQHSQPWDWYRDTIRGALGLIPPPAGSRLGFLNSFEFSDVLPEQTGNFAAGVHLVVRPPDRIFRVLPGFVYQRLRLGDFPALPFGNVTFNLDDTIDLITASPAYVDFEVTFTEPKNIAQLELEFLSRADGHFTMYIDGQLVGDMPESDFSRESGPVRSGDIRLASWIVPGVHNVRLRLDPGTASQSAVRIHGLDFGFEQSTPVGICLADFDDGAGTGTPDGGVTVEDLLYYLTGYLAGLASFDVDDGSGTGMRDGGVTVEDLLYFLVRYEAGC